MTLLVAAPSFGDEPPVGLERIVVTATGQAAPMLEVPQLATSVTARDLLDRGARTTPEALQEEVGILVQETNFGGGSPFIRGQTGNRILVLVDGVRLNNSTFRFGPNQYLNSIDPFSIDRIEVVRGPGSVLYGSDALGGVVNVVTKRRLDFDEPFGIDASATARFASAAVEKTVHGDFSSNYGPFGVTGGLTFRDFDDLRSGMEEQPHTGYDEIAGDLRLQYRLDDEREVAFSLQHFEQNEVPRTGAFQGGDEFFFDPQQRTLYALTHSLGGLPWGFGAWKSTLSFQDQREVRRRTERASRRTRREEDQVDTLGFTSDVDHRPMAGLLLLAGVEVYHDEVSSERIDTSIDTGESARLRGAFPDDTEYDTFGAYVQAESDVRDLLPLDVPLTLRAGGRYSRYEVDSRPPGFDPVDQDFDAWTGSLSAVYALTAQVNLIGSVAQGFRAPNLDDTVVLKEEPDLGLIDSPNPNLDPEEVVNYEGGIKWRHARGHAQLFYFYSDYRNLIERSTDGTGFDDLDGDGVQDPGELTFAQRRNIGEAVIQGVEAAGELEVATDVTLSAQVSWIRGENETDDEPVRRIPPVLGRAGVAYDPVGEAYWAELFARVADRQDRLSGGDKRDGRICPNGPEGCDGTPGWYTLNLRGGWQLNEAFEVGLSLENLTDERYRIHGSGIDAPGFNAIGTVTGKF